MSQTRFNIEKVREVNQLKIYSNDGNTTKLKFWAYLPNGFNIKASLKSGGMFEGVIDTFTSNFGGLLRIGNMLGLTDWAGGVDIKRYMFYSGSDPLSFTVNSFLILQEDYNKDILEPLQSLMDFTLPERGNEIADVANFISASMKKVEDKWKENQTQGGEFVAKIFSLLSQGYDAVRSFIGPVYTMHVPPQFGRKTSSEKGQVNNTVFFGRHFYFEDCYIENINLGIPPFLVEGGRPDLIEVSLSIKTARNATSNMFKFNEVQDTGEDQGWQWI